MRRDRKLVSTCLCVSVRVCEQHVTENQWVLECGCVFLCARERGREREREREKERAKKREGARL